MGGEAGDGVVDAAESFGLVAHFHQCHAYIGLCAVGFGLVAERAAEVGLLRGPVEVLLVVFQAPRHGDQQVEHLFALVGAVSIGGLNQALKHLLRRVELPVEGRVAVDLGFEQRSLRLVDIAHQEC